MREASITVTFGKANSQYFPEAVKVASRLPGYSTESDGKYTTHSVAVPISLVISNRTIWTDLETLAMQAARWKSTEIFIDGKSARYGLNAVRDVAHCFRGQQSSGLGDDYCRGKNAPDSDSETFGCHQLGGVGRSIGWRGAHAWYQFGALSSDRKVFHADKTKIRAILAEQTKNQVCVHCPAFSKSRLDEETDSLPDIIELESSNKFEIKHSEVNPDQALGIRLKQRPFGSSFGINVRLAVSNAPDDKETNEELPSVRNVANVLFSDVAGLEDAISEIRDVVQLPLTHSEYFLSLGMAPHRGIILYGPPGNGKPLLVKAVATESNAHLEIINGPEILSKWVGQTEANLRKVFIRARNHQPSIVLIDELDAIASKREGMQHCIGCP